MPFIDVQTMNSINVMSSESQNLQVPANGINPLSGSLMLIGQGPLPLNVGQMQGVAPYTNRAAEQIILDAFTNYVTVIQKLSNILIGKADLLNDLALIREAGLLNDLALVGAPITSSPRNYEAVLDACAADITNACLYVTAELTKQKNALNETIGQVIKAYTPAAQ